MKIKVTPPKLFFKFLFIVFIFGGLLWLIIGEQLIERPDKLYTTASGSVDMCLSCHKDVTMDPAHDPGVIGCFSCHLGDPLAVTEKQAHQGMVLNPGDLRHVEKTCSVEGCHPTDVRKVKNSLMATNRGIIGTLLYYWGESETQNSELTVADLIESGQSSFALDYFRKLCATCHLWKQKNDMPGLPKFFNEKGGGCSACHYKDPDDTKSWILEGDDTEESDGESPKKRHPWISAKVENKNCVRCHNRSGRIGISYMGIFESEGYGTPYEKGSVSGKQLPGARFYLEVAEDIHHKQGLECIDCHTRDEIMGDGTSYAHYEEQLEISCESCHAKEPGVTRKGNLLTNYTTEGDKHVLVGKVHDKSHVLKPPKSGVCDFKGHQRVTCEACHSTWVAQCYGCHARRDESRTHLDKLSLQETEGLWEEGRSYIRYEKPMLGVWDDEIVVVTPGCQDIVTVVDKKGNVSKSFERYTMAAINPHTTQAKGRSCVDCHASTKTVGLGEGRFKLENDALLFIPTDKGIRSSSGENIPFDSYVDLSGEPMQNSSRPTLRPFNRTELTKILRLGLCVGCHDSYFDPVWKNYTPDTKCARPITKSTKTVVNQ